MQFYLGVPEGSWLTRSPVPMFISRRRLARYRRTLPRAIGRYVIDSGGFTELDRFHAWTFTPAQYVAEIRGYCEHVGRPDWVAPMDYMCEPQILAKTNGTVREHQVLTIQNYLQLSDALGDLVAPVLQGWTPDDYLRHVDAYSAAGVDLARARVVGVGSVCRRQNDNEGAAIFRRLQPLGLRLHGFGVKKTGLRLFADVLASSDSMAWSADARNTPRRLPGCSHKNCGNCYTFAHVWRDELLESITPQLWGTT